MDASLTGHRETCHNQAVEVVLHAFGYRNGIGNGVCLVVVGGDGVELRVEVPALAILFAGTVPACFDLHSIGDVAMLYAELIRERDGGQNRVTGPLRSLEVVNRAGGDGDKDGNLIGEFLIGITG